MLDHADRGAFAIIFVITVGNGVTEELFHRGAVYAAVGRRYG